MSRIGPCFERLQRDGRTALIPYITAGDPEPKVTVPLMHSMVEAGADIIELGVPFSDPMAEGPIIQHACERALRHHTSLNQVMEMVKAFRADDDTTPVVLMGYLNPVEVKGYEAFAQDAASVGVDGVIIVDLPPEEAGEYVAFLNAQQIDPVFLLAPTSGDERIHKICATSGGFVYYVSLRGVTGAAHLDTQEAAAKVEIIRRATKLPVGVGFGISDAQSAAQVAQFADAVIVGSAIVKRIAARVDATDKINAEVSGFLKELRHALDDITTDQAVTTA
ncbi:MAG TPA: tryptophan synthase subunit alpha [Acidiferrobacteraceae bacterium]|nr:tryptophan synthase subunit alpha [Acidiferrobacteraceae bacterium]